MPYSTSNYTGDSDYPVNATGDVVEGDEVRFDRATFSGSYRSARFEGFVRETATVVAESYGASKQQHTFTLLRADGSKLRIKGRNLYRQGVWRKRWDEEEAREKVAAEKHARGDRARADRDARIMEAIWT
ncbi:MAG: hypothetical protein IT209_00665 [Armatimonadetes bacterium]|nr:hypothetical protein [Armatimonadota bacterium]